MKEMLVKGREKKGKKCSLAISQIDAKLFKRSDLPPEPRLKFLSHMSKDVIYRNGREFRYNSL